MKIAKRLSGILISESGHIDFIIFAALPGMKIYYMKKKIAGWLRQAGQLSTSIQGIRN
jgi:hypothetical protein